MVAVRPRRCPELVVFDAGLLDNGPGGDEVVGLFRVHCGAEEILGGVGGKGWSEDADGAASESAGSGRRGRG